MSAHTDFVKDFPQRCSLLFRQVRPYAKQTRREVTFMISLAASGVVIPYQRLSTHNRFAMFDDQTQYKEAKKKFDSLMRTEFPKSGLLTRPKEEWCMGGLDYSPAQTDNWPEMDDLQAIGTQAVGDVLKLLRDSIAHGNIVTKGYESSSDNPDQPPEITAVWFCRKEEKPNEPPFKYVCVTPEAFAGFLDKWFEFCAKLPLPEGILAGV